MKCLFAWTAALLVACAPQALAQTASSPSSKPLAQVAKEEEARRKSVKRPAKVYTNGSLRADSKAPDAAPTTPASAAAADAPGNTTPGSPSASAPPAAASNTPEYWAGRMKTAREQLQRTQLFADSLQTRINSLWTDFVNRDDPAQKAKLEQDRNTALAELERVKKEIAEQTKKIGDIEDEARRAGVPAGWLRPGA